MSRNWILQSLRARHVGALVNHAEYGLPWKSSNYLFYGLESQSRGFKLPRKTTAKSLLTGQHSWTTKSVKPIKKRNEDSYNYNDFYREMSKLPPNSKMTDKMYIYMLENFLEVAKSIGTQRFVSQQLEKFNKEEILQILDIVIPLASELGMHNKGSYVLIDCLNLASRKHRAAILRNIMQNPLPVALSLRGNKVFQNLFESATPDESLQISTFSLSRILQLSLSQSGSYIIQDVFATNPQKIDVMTQILSPTDENKKFLDNSEFTCAITLLSMHISGNHVIQDLLNVRSPEASRLRETIAQNGALLACDEFGTYVYQKTISTAHEFQREKVAESFFEINEDAKGKIVEKLGLSVLDFDLMLLAMYQHKHASYTVLKLFHYVSLERLEYMVGLVIDNVVELATSDNESASVIIGECIENVSDDNFLLLAHQFVVPNKSNAAYLLKKSSSGTIYSNTAFRALFKSRYAEYLTSSIMERTKRPVTGEFRASEAVKQDHLMMRRAWLKLCKENEDVVRDTKVGRNLSVQFGWQMPPTS